MSDLPDRGVALDHEEISQVIAAYLRSVLKSRDEMNLEAAAAVLKGDDGFGPIDVSSWEQWAETLLDAAWGVGDE